jgi:hypothetical protein
MPQNEHHQNALRECVKVSPIANSKFNRIILTPTPTSKHLAIGRHSKRTNPILMPIKRFRELIRG